MNVFKIIPTTTGSTGCALIAANTEEEAVATYKNSLNYRQKQYENGGCISDIIACLECTTKNPAVLFDCIKL